jgi:hypothetical protein
MKWIKAEAKKSGLQETFLYEEIIKLGIYSYKMIHENPVIELEDE